MVRAGPALGPASIAACMISLIKDCVSSCVRSATVFFALRGVVLDVVLDICKDEVLDEDVGMPNPTLTTSFWFDAFLVECEEGRKAFTDDICGDDKSMATRDHLCNK